MLFRTKEPEKRDWAMGLISDGVIPGYSTGSFIGISALKNSDVLTAVSIIASNVARFPLLLLDEQSGKPLDSGDLAYLLNKKPNPMLDGYHWKFIMTVNALLANDGVSRIVRDPVTQEPALIQYFPPSQVYIDDSDVNNIKYEFTPLGANQTIVEPAKNVIHFKFFTYDGIHGRSPLLSLRDEINLQESGIQTLSKFFQSGLKGGILKVKGKLNKQARKKAREDFEYAQQGATGGSPVVTDDTIDYQTLEVDTNILQLINSNNYSTSQIAKAMHIPAYKLGVNSPNQSVKQLNDDFIKSDLPYYFEPISSEIELKMLNDQQRHQFKVQFDTRKETGMSVADAKNAVDGSLLDPNEARFEMGVNKRDDPNMDRMQSNLNNVYLDMKEDYQNPNKPDNTVKTINERRKAQGQEPIEGGDAIYMSSSDIPAIDVNDTGGDSDDS
jgi:HK97 family phage portal protein